MPCRSPQPAFFSSLLERKLSDARRLGYAIVDEEVELGLRTIAVPIRNTGGTVVAALVVAVRAGRIEAQKLPEALLPLMAPAQDALKQIC